MGRVYSNKRSNILFHNYNNLRIQSRIMKLDERSCHYELKEILAILYSRMIVFFLSLFYSRCFVWALTSIFGVEHRKFNTTHLLIGGLL